MAAPAAILNVLLTANAAPATAALGKTQTQLGATAAAGNKAGAAMKKAFLGIGIAAGAAGVALFKVGQEFDEAYDKIRVGTGATGRALEDLKGDFREVVKGVPASFDDAGTAVADLNTRLGLSGKPLQRLSQQMLELSRITETDVGDNIETVSRAFVDWEVKTKDQSKTLDGFFRLSQASGASVSKLAQSVQEFGSPLRQLGFTLEESAAMFATFERAGVNTETMVPGLKLAISNLTRPTDALSQTMEKLSITVGKPDKALREVFALISDKGLPAVEKTGLAMDVFGKRAGADMAEAIAQGRFEFDDFIKVMSKGNETIRKAGRDTMDLSEHWKLFTNRLKVAVEPTAVKVFDTVGKAMKELGKIIADPKLSAEEKFSKILDKVIAAVTNAIPEMTKAGVKVGLKLAEGLVKGFIEAPILGKLFMGAALIRLFGGSGALLASGRRLGTPIGRGVGMGILAGLVLLDPAVQKKLKEMVSGEELGATARENFSQELGGLGLDVSHFIGRHKVAVDTAWGRLVFDSKTKKVVDAAGKNLQGLVGQKTIDVAAELQDGVLDIDRKVKWDRIFGSFSRLLNKVPGVVKGDADQAFGHWDNFLSDITSATRSKGDKVPTILKRQFGAAANAAQGEGKDAFQNWDRWLSEMTGATRSKTNRAKSILEAQLGDAADAAGNKGRNAFQNWDKWMESTKGVTRNKTDAIGSILSGGLGKAWASARNTTDRAVDAIKDKMGAFSGIGKSAIDGLINGLRSKTGALFSAASSIVGSLISTMKAKAKSKSPSKETMALGGDLMNGLAGGIDKFSTRAVVAARKAGGNVIAALSEKLDSLSGIISTLGGAERATPEELAQLGGALSAAKAALPGAQIDAQRALVDARFAATDAAQAQADAQARLNELLARGDAATRPDVQKAIAEADYALAKAKESNARAQYDLNTLEQKGIEGADQVVSAKQAITDAQNALTAAQNQGKDAVSQLTEALKAQQVQMLQNLATAQMAEREGLEKRINKLQRKLKRAKGGKEKGRIRENLQEAKDALESLAGVTGGGGAFASTITQLLDLGALTPQQALSALGLPSYDKGGTIPGPVGAPRVIVAHGGEEVVPRDRQGGTVNQYFENHFHEPNDADAIASRLSWLARTA